MLLMSRAVVVLVVTIAAAAAATTSASEAQTPVQVIVTRDALTLPAGCTPRSLAELLDRFFDAFERSDAAELDRLVAPAGSGPPAFTLLSVDDVVTYERDRVVPYLVELRSRGEHFRLLAGSIERTGSIAPTSVNVNYRVERPGGTYLAKGLIDCATQRLWQGAIGPRISGPLTLPCPRPPGWSVSGPVVMCTTGPNARALSPAFRVAGGSARLPAPCRATRVRSAVRDVLTSFDNGRGTVFAARFAARARLRAYGSEVNGRRALMRFVRTRYEAGDGWTASRLEPPRRTDERPEQAMYRLRIAVSLQGSVVSRDATARLAVNCRTGLLGRWTGPSVPLPTLRR
jgi:hypothetical protein